MQGQGLTGEAENAAAPLAKPLQPGASVRARSALSSLSNASQPPSGSLSDPIELCSALPTTFERSTLPRDPLFTTSSSLLRQRFHEPCAEDAQLAALAAALPSVGAPQPLPRALRASTAAATGLRSAAAWGAALDDSLLSLLLGSPPAAEGGEETLLGQGGEGDAATCALLSFSLAPFLAPRQ
jgi:hypothetical protein